MQGASLCDQCTQPLCVACQPTHALGRSASWAHTWLPLATASAGNGALSVALVLRQMPCGKGPACIVTCTWIGKSAQ
eukprot:13059349-Alexandrium_andersonii.AAC.1